MEILDGKITADDNSVCCNRLATVAQTQDIYYGGVVIGGAYITFPVIHFTGI